ncbi:MAG: chemotaxis protein CheW [Thiobacillus sp. SCN 63-374]|nr:MAG: chemotaxis protein CheW [Thiobacillus sp. SCN 63-374]
MSALVKMEERTGLAAPQDQQQYLTFMLGGETFAIGILAIKEIIEYGNLTEVPMMPDYIRGVINLRGSVVPVVDLSTRETQVVGVVVDAVNEVLEIPQDQIEPPPAFGAKIRTDFIRGMGKVDSKFVIILNVGNVLSIDDLALLEQANRGMESANEAAAG